MEVESGGVIEGLRGFQGEPRLGLPLGRVIGCPVQLEKGAKAAWWRSMTGNTLAPKEKNRDKLML
jgi:hypothetical protein